MDHDKAVERMEAIRGGLELLERFARMVRNMDHKTAAERTEHLARVLSATDAADAADAEALDKLLAELEPLAKTRDGVPVYVGMAVWTREPGVLQPWPWRVTRIEDGSVGVSCEGRYTNRLLTNLYASREAAQKVGEG